MKLTYRIAVVLGVMAAVLLLANTGVICGWLEQAGLIGLAQWLRREYLTGTAITVIVVILWIVAGWRHVTVVGLMKECRVCRQTMEPHSRYCPHCGSRA